MDRLFRLHQDSHIRAADADRDQVAERLRAACAEGRLSPDELSARLDACLRAKTFGELRPLVADLPAPGAAVAPRPGRALSARRRFPHPALIVLAVVGVYALVELPAWLVAGVGIGTVAFAFAVLFNLAPIILVVLATVWLVRRVFGPPAHRLF